MKENLFNFDHHMSEHKYIVTKDEDCVEEIFIFPKSINHDDFMSTISRMKLEDHHGNWTRVVRLPVSAGFITDCMCHGRSQTLKLDAREEDTLLLNKLYG